MAHTKSAKKRIVTAAKSRLRNQSVKSRVKTTIKKFEAAVEAKNTEEAKALYTSVVKSLDMATSKGVVHKNMAARKKSRLAAKLNAMA